MKKIFFLLMGVFSSFPAKIGPMRIVPPPDIISSDDKEYFEIARIIQERFHKTFNGLSRQDQKTLIADIAKELNPRKAQFPYKFHFELNREANDFSCYIRERCSTFTNRTIAEQYIAAAFASHHDPYKWPKLKREILQRLRQRD